MPRLNFKFLTISPTLSFWLDIVRGLAAFVVLIGHIRERFFGGYGPDVTGIPDVFIKIFYVLFGMGTQAVMCFFVMSGLLIAPKFLKGRTIDGAYLGDYTLARLSRLYVVAIPALLISMAVAKLSMIQFGQFPTVFGDQCSPGIKDLAINLAFLSKAFYPVICSNAPFWSIHNETFYYALFPVLVLSLVSPRPMWRLVSGAILAVAAIALIAFDPVDIHNTLLLFPIWILGGMTLALPRPKGGSWFWGIMTVIAVIVPNLLPFKSTWLIEDYVLAITLCLFLRSVADSTFTPPAWLGSTAKWLADISFSLYLSHIFLVNYVRSYLEFGRGISFPFREFDWFTVSVYVGTTALCVLWAQLFYMAFEKHTPIVRARVTGLLMKHQRVPTGQN